MIRGDEAYRSSFFLSTNRNAAHWKYLLAESQETEFGAEYWILEYEERSDAFYCRIPVEGCGTGY